MLVDKQRPISLEDCGNVELHIHILGYNPKGESILIILWDKSDSTILKSILIDCYEINGVNKFENLFVKYSLKSLKLDYVIWTHPDLDHSSGMHKIIENYTDENTKILVPEGLTFAIFTSTKSILWKSWFALKKKSQKDKRSVRYVSADYDSLHLRVFGDKYEDGYGHRFSFNIEILSPISCQSFRLSQILKKLPKNNISIAVNIQFGHNKFFFGGDIVNDVINEIQQERFINTIFVKIPHHASSTSSNLAKIYTDIYKTNGGSKLMHSVSTMYEQNTTHLPDYSVLNTYQNFSRYILLTDKTPHFYNYGIWSFRYKYTGCLPIGYNKDGDAGVLFDSTGKKMKLVPIP